MHEEDSARASDKPRSRRVRKDGLLTTGDMARLSRSTLRAVRFYEEQQILRPIARSSGGHRLFSKRELEKLLLVSDMRAAGLSLDEIKHALELKSSSKSGADAAQRVDSFLREQIEAMSDKLQALQRLQQDFELAREVFGKCRRCRNEQTYPAKCDRCRVMRPPLPRSVRVLWTGDGQASS